jgi:hypothetical protein
MNRNKVDRNIRTSFIESRPSTIEYRISSREQRISSNEHRTQLLPPVKQHRGNRLKSNV